MGAWSLQDFIHAIQDHGIQTRLIQCAIPIDLAPLESTTASIDSRGDEAFLREYELLNASSSDLIAQAIHFAGKEKNTSLTLILELLMDLHEKITRLEEHVLAHKRARLELPASATIHALGHGVLGCGGAGLVEGRFYYVRFALPSAASRDIAAFARALSPELLQIVRIHSTNTTALDSFIVAKEMEQLRQKRTAHD